MRILLKSFEIITAALQSIGSGSGIFMELFRTFKLTARICRLIIKYTKFHFEVPVNSYISLELQSCVSNEP